jgi:hypothetical protein
MQRPARSRIELDRSDAPALQQFAEVVQCLHEIAHRLRRVRLEIGAPDDAFARRHVDENQRPFGDGRDPRDDGPLQRKQHCTRPDAFERQRGRRHGAKRARPRCQGSPRTR